MGRSILKPSHAFTALGLAAVAVCGVVACNAFDGTPTDEGGGATGDAGAPDATIAADGASPLDATLDGTPIGTDASAAEASVPSGALFDGFEDGTVGNACANWICDTCTTQIVVGIAHSGTKSCQVCASGTNSVGVTRRVPVDGGANYVFDVFVATMNDGGVSGTDGGGTAGAYMYFYDDAGVATEVSPASFASLTPRTWGHVQAMSAMPIAASAVEARPSVYVTPNVTDDCWYFDDAHLYTP